MSLDDPEFTLQETVGQPKHHIRAPFDDYARAMIEQQPDCIIAWWLGACYLYYQKAESLLSDPYFDDLAEQMRARWETIRHPHKYLIHPDDLAAGTGFMISEEQYPSITKSAAERLMRSGVMV